VLPLAALLSGNLGAAVAIMATYGFARALAVVIAVSAARGDFVGACDAIQGRLIGLKRVVGLVALAFAALILIF